MTSQILLFVLTTFFIVLFLAVTNITLAVAFRAERKLIENSQKYFPDKKVSKTWYWIFLVSIFVFNILYGFLFLFNLNILFS